MTAAALGPMTADTLLPGWRDVLWPGRKTGGVMASVPDDEWLTGEAAARLAGCDPATIWRASKDGKIGYTETGQGESGTRGPDRRYRRRDVEAFRPGRRRRVGTGERLTRVEADVEDLRSRVARLEADAASPDDLT